MRHWEGPVVLDRATKQCDGLLVGAKIHLAGARGMQPEPSRRVVRREAKRLVFMSFNLFVAPGE